MKMRILGVSTLDFKANDGNHIKGNNLFVAFKDDNVQGERTDKLFLKDGIKLPNVKIGSTVEVTFNMRGKVESIQLAEA